MFQRIGEIVTRFASLVVVLWIAIGLAFWFFGITSSFENVVVDGEFSYLPDDARSRQNEKIFHAAFDDIVESSVVVVVRRPNGESGLKDRDLEFIDKILKPRIVAVALAEGGLAHHNEEPGAEALDEEGLEDTAAVTPADLDYVLERIRPAVEEYADEEGWETHFIEHPHLPEFAAPQAENAVPNETPSDEPRGEPNSEAVAPARPRRSSSDPESVIARVRTPSNKKIGPLLKSRDGKAALVMVELNSEFQAQRNRSTIKSIELLLAELASDTALRKEWGTVGLDTTVSGLAVVGRDRRLAEESSAKATEKLTIVLVVLLLVLIYRAPLLAIVPLLTVAISVHIAIGVLALMAKAHAIDLFTGVKVYVIVLMYGAGVDYCLFLLARYKEELDRGASTNEAIANSVGRIGAAVAASAGTTMCGIGMMYYADFGKFSQAGVAIPLSLFFVLLATLTFTPALLTLCGSWAFWPHLTTRQLPKRSGWISPTSYVSRVMESEVFTRFWEHMANWLQKRPATIWLAAVAVMLPFAVVGLAFYSDLSYGLLSELPENEPSVVGAEAVQMDFPAGTTGPVTVLLRNNSVEFDSKEGQQTIRNLSENLVEHAEELGIEDVRSVVEPWGIHVKPSFAQRALLRQNGPKFYVSHVEPYDAHLTRIDVIFDNDPFERHSIASFERFESRMPSLLPEDLRKGTTLGYVGATPSMRDLQITTDRDQIRVDVIVSVAVFLILVLLLGRRAPLLVAVLCAVHFVWMFVAVKSLGLPFTHPAFWLPDVLLLLVVIGLRGQAASKSAYLMLSVLFSYFVTLGATITVYYLLDPSGFAGLDWKVPMFLFTILVAVGQDYNIYLVTRVEEEQEQHGPVDGIKVALARTGGIISSCGVIMAGTFASLMFGGSLLGMQQLGFALAFGVLLDTFVIRPILVPAYLILLHGGRFGTLGRYLGAGDAPPPTPMQATPNDQPASGGR